MNAKNWQLDEPLTAILFDCDSTLVKIEGIDELATEPALKKAIAELTDIGMSQTGLTPDLYAKRLDLLKPTLQQIEQLGDTYINQLVEDSVAIIATLHRLHKQVYLVSAGLYPAICKLAYHLQIPQTHVMAVQLGFDDQGNYLDFDHSSPLIHNIGKRQIAESLKTCFPTLALIGDGLSDSIASDVVTRFIGYGGVCYRPKVVEQSSIYSRSASLAPILPLCLTEHEVTQLNSLDKQLYDKGLTAIAQGEVIFSN